MLQRDRSRASSQIPRLKRRPFSFWLTTLSFFSSVLVLSQLTVASQTPFDQTEVLAFDFFNLSDVIIMDVDADGDNDLLYVRDFDGIVGYFENENNESYIGPIIIFEGIPNVSEIQAQDINLDGRLDLVTIDASSGSIGWCQGIETGFLDPVIFISNLGQLTQVYFADIDLDGDNDILWSAGPDGSLWLENLGDLDFSSLISFFETGKNVPQPVGITILDWNEDGDQDLVFPDNFSQSMLYAENNGEGLFEVADTLFTLVPSPGFIFSLASDILITDLDGDQDDDFVVSQLGFNLAFSQSSEVGVYENLGEGNYAYRLLATEDSLFVNDVKVGDINGRGVKEIVLNWRGANGVESEFLDKIVVYRADCGGNWLGEIVDYSSVNPISIDLGDVNGNGRLELVSASRGDYKLAVLSSNTGLPHSSFNVSSCTSSSFCNSSVAYFPDCTFEWDFGDGNTSNDPFLEAYFFEEIGTYEVSLTACNDLGCDTFMETVDVERVVNTEIPSTGIPGEAIQFENNSVGFTNTTWDFGDGQTSIETSPEHTYEAPGLYELEVFITENSITACTVQQTHIIDVNWPSGIEGDHAPIARIFPNPSSDWVTITSIEGIYNIEIRDMNSRLIAFHSGVEGDFQFSVADIPSGIYHVSIAQSTEPRVLKLCVIK